MSASINFLLKQGLFGAKELWECWGSDYLQLHCCAAKESVSFPGVFAVGSWNSMVQASEGLNILLGSQLPLLL